MSKIKTITLDEIQKLRKQRKKGIDSIVINSKRVEDPICSEESPVMGLFRGFLQDRKKAGFAINWDHGTVISYGSIDKDIGVYAFFRGENKFFPGDATSSIGRTIDKNDSSLTVYTKLLIQNIKIKILSEILYKNEILNNWRHGTIFAYIIAQHYGLKTQYLDVTDDIDVALFFANTYEKNGKFHPIFKRR